MSNNLVEINQKDFSVIKDMDSSISSFDVARQYFMRSGNGNIFIKKAGLEYKFNQKFAGKSYTIKNIIPSEEEYEMFKKMYKFNDNELFFLIKVQLIFLNEKSEYTEWGIASSRDCHPSQLAHGVYMAETRGLNRIMRILTSSGFCSVEEMVYETVGNNNNNSDKTIDNAKNITLKNNGKKKDNNYKQQYFQLRNEFRNLLNNSEYPLAEAQHILKNNFNVEYTKDLTISQFEDYIILLKEAIFNTEEEGENHKGTENTKEDKKEEEKENQVLKDLLNYASKKGVNRAGLRALLIPTNLHIDSIEAKDTGEIIALIDKYAAKQKKEDNKLFKGNNEPPSKFDPSQGSSFAVESEVTDAEAEILSEPDLPF